jgi:hypothetical protein
VYPINVTSSRGHFLRNNSLEVSTQGHELTIRDELLRPVRRITLGPTMTYINPQINSAIVRDHLLVVVVGTTVSAVHLLGGSAEKDVTSPRVLWQQSLTDGAAGQTVNLSVQQVIVNGVARQILTDAQGQPLGSLGPVSRDAVVLQRGRKLLAIESLTGKTLWQRDDLPPGMRLFGDDDFVLAVARGATEARAFRAIDGADAGTRPVPKQEDWLDVMGRNLLVWQKVDPKSPVKIERVTPDGLKYQVVQPGKPKMSLALVDAATGQDVRRQYYTDDTRQTVIAHEEFAVL